MAESPILPSAKRDAAREVARSFGHDHDLATALDPFRAHRWDVAHHGRPTLQLDDVSGIPFLVDVAGVEEYQHRGRLRAQDRDLYATVTRAVEGYETYCQETLALGAPEHLVATPAGPPIAVARACASGATYARLVEVARSARGFVLHPYMGIEDVWALAEKLAIDARVSVSVLGPPPPVTWIANDKSAFDSLVERVLGREALVETRTARTRHEITQNLEALAAHNPRVGLKRTRCASAMGNAVFSASELTDGARGVVDAFLERTEWPEGEEVLAVAWHDAAISPSTQLWLPPSTEGAPRLDGIYEQILAGEERVFVGSRPSTLPIQVNRALGEQALMVATALQELGYVGRCSFDHLLQGDPEGDFRVVLTECNGRWGGTSMPMSLVDRVVRGPRPAYQAQDVVYPGLVGAEFADIVRLVGNTLFDTLTGRGRFLFYNLGPLANHGKFDVISLGRDPQDAERGITEVLPSLLQA
ncbi:MAG: hypothetical protein AAF436_15395 [Myxococcota bacterium]